MSKRTWFKVKRGILDPKHRYEIGIRIWLYMHILDRANWETGIVFDWRDKEEAQDLDMPWRTLQEQRQLLEKSGYITCQQRKNCIDILIHNWTNPREYSGEEYNVKDKSTESSVPSKSKGTGKDTGKDTGKGSRKSRTPSSNSHVTDHRVTLILSRWKELFPNKKQPKPGTLKEKILTRFKSSYFVENWEAAMLKASNSHHLQSNDWFQLEYFVRSRATFEKVLIGVFDSFDRQSGMEVPVDNPNEQAEYEATKKREQARVSKLKPLYSKEQLESLETGEKK